MSKSITEKELAEALDDRMDNLLDNNGDLDTLTVARTAAKLLGYEFAPEKPEPGWYLVESGKYAGCGAQVANGRLGVYASGLSLPVVYQDHNDWPTMRRLVPEGSRVVPAEPVELSEEEVGECHDSTPESSGYGWLEWTKPSRECFTATVNAALAKHGHGRVEVSREQVLAVVKKGIYETPWSEDRNEAITNAVMELLEASK